MPVSPLSISGVHDFPDLSHVDALVSIRDPDSARPPAVEASGAPVFDLVFHDVGEEPDDLDTSPELWHLERLLRFLEETRPTRIHVHCFYGVSRSTAVASLIAAQQHPELTDDAVVSRVLKVRPQAHPNRTLLALIDELLGRNLSTAWAERLDRY